MDLYALLQVKMRTELIPDSQESIKPFGTFRYRYTIMHGTLRYAIAQPSYKWILRIA